MVISHLLTGMILEVLYRFIHPFTYIFLDGSVYHFDLHGNPNETPMEKTHARPTRMSQEVSKWLVNGL